MNYTQKSIKIVIVLNFECDRNWLFSAIRRRIDNRLIETKRKELKKRASHSDLLSYMLSRIEIIFVRRTHYFFSGLGLQNKILMHQFKRWTSKTNKKYATLLNALQSVSAHYSFGSRKIMKKKTSTYYSFSVVRGMNAGFDCFACILFAFSLRSFFCLFLGNCKRILCVFIRVY